MLVGLLIRAKPYGICSVSRRILQTALAKFSKVHIVLAISDR